MIPLKRGPAPAFFASELTTRMRDAAVKSYATSRETAARTQRPRRFNFGPYLKQLEHALYDSLVGMSHGKCAYCESPMLRTKPRINPFRPVDGVGESSGRYLGDHYWAQAFEWSNYYACCETCARYKGNRFPVVGMRAPAGAFGKALATEEPALLDPCTDDPGDHLAFFPDGRMAGRTDRGRQTIEILGLSRANLVSWRAEAAKRFLKAVHTSRNVEGLLADNQPYAAMKRQLRTEGQLRTRRGALSGRQKALIEQQDFDAKRAKIATEGRTGLRHYRARARFIERVQINNFLPIERLDLDLSESEAERAPCLAVLGENAVGKSSVLRAIALTLGGKAYLARRGLRPSDLLRAGAESGEVSVWISGFSEPAVMQFSRRARTVRFTQEHSRALVLGYGSSRLLPTRFHRPMRGMAHAKIDNLFDPFLPLADAQSWLSRASAAQFEEAEERIRELLLLPDEARLIRPRSRSAQVAIEFRSRGRSRAASSRHPFDRLSDGYQSMLGFAADLMEIMFGQGYTSMESAQGVVLIDELGNHLHPRWRMQIVGRLRAAFPNVQFIFSTHDPLCLRGLLGGEIVVLQLDARHKVYALTELPAVTGLRVDQLLRSEHFGLGSTIEPEMQQDYERYLALKRKAKLTGTQAAERRQLESRLFDARVLASTPQERAALEYMDEARQRGPGNTARNLSAARLTEAAKSRLRTLFEKTRA